MHIDIIDLLLGMATLAALLGGLFAAKVLLEEPGPLPPELGKVVSINCYIFSAWSALFLLASYRADGSAYQDRLVDNQAMYAVGTALFLPLAVFMFRRVRSWSPSDN